MRPPRAVNSLIDNLFERKYRKVGQEKKALGFFLWVFCFNIVTPGKGSKYREFYALSGCITCMYCVLSIKISTQMDIAIGSSIVESHVS